jgi:acyl-CoA thioesterase I
MKKRKRLILATVFYFLICGAVYGQDKTLRVACVGNSITNGGLGSQSYPQQLNGLMGEHYDVRNYGVGGTTLLKNGDFPYWDEYTFERAIEFDPHIVIILLGTNDSKPQNWIYENEFYNDYLAFIQEFRKDGKDPQIYVGNPPPVFVPGLDINGDIIRDEIIPILDSVRVAMQTFIIEFHDLMLTYGSLFPDGIHPNAEGYTIMANISKESLMNGPSGFIRQFASESNSVELGESTMLYWETTNGSSVTFDGVLVAEIDSIAVSPAQKTTYTLIASGVTSDTNFVTVDYLAPGLIKFVSADPPILDAGLGDSTEISWETTNGSTVIFDGETVDQNGSKTVTPTITTTYTIIASGVDNDTTEITVQVLPSDIINRALNHPVTASSTAADFPPEFAVDGDEQTLWQSEGANTQWFYVDLGKMVEINRIVIKWGDNFSTLFHIQGLDTNNVTQIIHSDAAGDGGVDDITGLSSVVRYVRLLCIKGGEAGYALKEFEVYYTPGQTSVAEKMELLPTHFVLEQNYPNPFNPITTINYSIFKPEKIRLDIFDLTGRKVRTIVDEFKTPGRYQVLFDGTNLSSGYYVYQLTAGNRKMQKNMILVK